MVYGGGTMMRWIQMAGIELKLIFRGIDSIVFGMIMPIGILILITVIAGDSAAGEGGYTFLDSAFASLIAVGICASAFMGIPLTLADYRDKKILKHFFVTPCSPSRLLGVIVACHVVVAALSALSISVVAVLAFGYEMKGNLLLFIAVWLLTLAAMFSIGLLLASVCKGIKTTNAITGLVYFPMLFLSGATIPFELFPDGLQNIASLLPLSQGIRLMKLVSLGQSSEAVLGIVVLLLAITLICCMISVKAFRWEV